MKRLWRDPDAAGTGADGTQGREVGRRPGVGGDAGKGSVACRVDF